MTCNDVISVWPAISLALQKSQNLLDLIPDHHSQKISILYRRAII